MYDAVMARIEERAKHFGPIRDANGYAGKRGECGDLAEIWLRIDGGKIRRASFMTDGCGWSSHCCHTAVSMVEGWKTEAAAELTQAQVLAAAGKIPEDHRHCALLAAETVKLAVVNFTRPPEIKTLGQRIKTLFTKEVHRA